LIYLVLSVLFSTGLIVIFKYFGIYKIDVLKAIFVNYIVAFSMGFFFAERQIPISEIYLEPWFSGALFLGALFVSIFFVMAMTAQKNGVSVTSIAGKMSVVVPVFFGIILYNESVTFFKNSRNYYGFDSSISVFCKRRKVRKKWNIIITYFTFYWLWYN